jgi:hypothetical protein
MRAVSSSLVALAGVAVLMIAAPRSASAVPSVLPITHGVKVGDVTEVGYRYRRYGYRRPYYRRYGYRGYGYRGYGYRGYGYRPYYRPYYGYYRPYYRPYYGGYYGGYGYPYYRRPGVSLWFGF